MLTEVDMERIMAAKRQLFEQESQAIDYDIVDDFELLDDAEYEFVISETNGLM